jgi:hypothetical protein
MEIVIATAVGLLADEDAIMADPSIAGRSPAGAAEIGPDQLQTATRGARAVSR